MLNLPDEVYNWLKNYFDGHSHSTRLGRQMSTFVDIFASVIQGSGVCPASYIVCAADLHPLTPGNKCVNPLAAMPPVVIVNAHAVCTRSSCRSSSNHSSSRRRCLVVVVVIVVVVVVVVFVVIVVVVVVVVVIVVVVVVVSL